MRYSFRVISGLFVCTLLAAQTSAGLIPETSNATVAKYENEADTDSFTLETPTALEKRQDRVVMFSDDIKSPNYAHIFPTRAKIRDSSVYHAAERAGAIDTTLTIQNKEPTTIGVWLERDHIKLLMPGQEGRQNYIMIPPGHWALLRMPKKNGYVSTMRAFPGCDPNGWDCFGQTNAATQLEWNTNNPMDRHPGSWWVNLSLVRGYNIGMSYMGRGAGNTCPRLICNIPKKAIEDQCPAPNKVIGSKNGGNHAGCKSDCALAEAPHLCCSHGHGRGTCQESNQYLKNFCASSAYFWAFDDNRKMDCFPGGRMQVEIGGA